MRYSLLSLFLLTSLPIDAKTPIYEDMMNQYCSSFFNDIPTCLKKYQQSAIKKGGDFTSEDIYVENAIDKTFEDGQFTVNKLANGYRLVESIINPMADNTYFENRHHVFYFNPEMKNMEHILLNFRHGLYGGKNGKQIDNEIVHIERIQASIEELSEVIYVTPSWPTFEYNLLNLDGFQLYRYNLKNGGIYVTPNYTTLPNSTGSEGEWWPSKGHQPSFEKNIFASSTYQNINGNGSFDTEIQFGYEVYLLVKFNDDKTITLMSPYRDSNGLLTTNPKRARTLYPMNNREPVKPELLNDGWILNTSEFDIEKYSDFTSRFATTMVGDYPRFICRFKKFNDGYNHMLFGYVQVLYQDKYKKEAICTAGDDVYLITKNGNKEPVKSEINTFEWLSLKDTKLTGKKVTTKYERPLCSINIDNFYGVGLLSKNGVCEQDGDVFGSNDKLWRFSKNWTEYYYK
ncbi:hypothetical protein [Aliivibrio fischeri]|uniref:Uncharacterized protein n=1 Tax=Aliivibrio fischeri TaxID=668 RepID=A0A844P7I3_ALIFS|nr:hypothetical protein [Aliivibrio fischeri]MUK51195.1 hypothetical protein [Aliivibrio fischeri]